ncbi:MAG: PH domain-containing protein [Candidatus Pacearchaeota archaeon]
MEDIEKDFPEKKKKITLRNSRMIYLPYYLMALALLALGIYADTNTSTELATYGLYASIIFAIVVIFFAEGHRMLNIYEITPEYIKHHFGMVAKNTKSVHIKTISDFVVEQNLLQRLLNYGTIESHRYTEGETMDIILKGIPSPDKYARILQKQLAKKI